MKKFMKIMVALALTVSSVALGASQPELLTEGSPRPTNGAFRSPQEEELELLRERLKVVERENNVRKTGMKMRLFDHFLLAEAIYFALPYLGCSHDADVCWGLSRSHDALFYACVAYSLVYGTIALWMGLKGEYPTETLRRYWANRKKSKKPEKSKTTV